MPPEREAYRGAWRMMELARIYAMAGRPESAIDRQHRPEEDPSGRVLAPSSAPPPEAFRPCR